MKIIIFAGYYHPHVGGYCKNIHELAVRLIGKGHSVDVITCDTDSKWEYELRDSVNVIRIPTLFHVAGQVPIPKPSSMIMRILLSKYDVVITQTRIFPMSLIGAVYARIRNITLVHVERGSCHSVLGNKLFSWMVRVYDHTFGKLIIEMADKTVAISESAGEFVKHLSGKANPITIYNGIKIPEKQANDEFGRIVFVGRLIYAKGVQDLIKAFRLVSTLYDVELVVVGDGVYRKELEKQVTDMDGRVKFLGEMRQDKVMDLLSEGGIFVNPSYSEGLPTTVMEAASIGMPVIATDVGGTREVIDNYINGVLIPPHDINRMAQAMMMMSGDKRWAELIGNRAREKMGKFDWGEIADRWGKLLEEVSR